MHAIRRPSAEVQHLRQIVDCLNAQLTASMRCWRTMHGNLPMPLTDTERATIAALAKPLGWRAIIALRLTMIVTVDTLRRWHRRLVEQATHMPVRRPRHRGRPPIATRIRKLVCRIARQNPTWGYDRIRDALANLGITISDQSVGNILADHHIPPAGERGRRSRAWRSCIAAHWRTLASCDFASIPIATPTSLVWIRVLLVMHIATREIHVAAVTVHPNAATMQQVARELTMVDTGFLRRNGITHLIHDGDGAFLKTGFIPTLLSLAVSPPSASHRVARTATPISSAASDRSKRNAPTVAPSSTSASCEPSS